VSGPRVRFAPAPSGWLHVGSVRTALYNWLHAQGNDGTFIFRIEDTDAERATDESMRSMLEGMGWLGISVDEGVTLAEDGSVVEVGAHGPYRQSSRKTLHAAVARRLEAAGHLYADDRTPDELDAWRTAQREAGLPPIVKQVDVPAPTGDRPATLRLALPTEGSITVHDEVRGDITWEWANESDPVLVRSNGAVTYPLANSTDDVAQGVSLICRGDDLLSVTPRQVHLYGLLLANGLIDEALAEVGLPARDPSWGAPSSFAHLSMIVGADRKKLSKRHGSVAIQSFRDRGFLPDVLLNYVSLLGWAPSDGTERLTRDELVAKFDLATVGSSAAMFDTDKLTAFNGERIREMDAALLTEQLLPFLDGSRPQVAPEPDADGAERWVAYPALTTQPATPAQHAVVAGLVPLVQERMQRLDEVRAYAGPFLTDTISIDLVGAAKVLRKAGGAQLLREASAMLPTITWDLASIDAALRALAEEQGVGFGKLAQPIRVAVTGTTVSPPLFESMELIGQERCLARIEQAIAVFEAAAAAAAAG
jgi:glutamyl-tRNA synthetase